MILKKPYAFLIKNFRLIHLILAIPIIYLTYKFTNIVSFFNDYIANNYSLTINGDLSSIFINAFMYLGTALIILAAIAVYFLFKYKEKPRNNYIAIIIYYLILFIVLSVSHNILDVMEVEVIEASLARTYRDISILLLLPQIYFCLFTVLRALGFNIKKLNFADDLKELEISEKDNEEFEFVVGVEGYKAKRTFRRFLREFSYYIKENTFIFIALIFLVVVGMGTSYYLNRDNSEVNYKMNKEFIYKNFTISVADSITTNLAYNGKIISKDKYYLILKLDIANNTNDNVLLEHSNFRILIDNKYLFPIIDKASYFADYATPYDGKKIAANSSNTYVLVYELTKEELREEYLLKIYNGVNKDKNEWKSKYSNIELKPLLISEKSNVKTVNIREKLELTNSNIGNTSLTINRYQLTNKYIYDYERCYNNSCKNYTDYVAVDYFSSGQGSTLLVLDYDLLLDKKSAYSNYIKSKNAFFSNFASVKYEVNETEYIITPQNITPTNLDNTVVFQINSQIKDAKKIELLITIRNKIYTIKLK